MKSMSESQEPLVDVKKWIVCIVLTMTFWVFMTWTLLPFIPEAPPAWTVLWSAFTSFPIAGTFYLSSMCFTATLVAQIRQKRA